MTQSFLRNGQKIVQVSNWKKFAVHISIHSHDILNPHFVKKWNEKSQLITIHFLFHILFQKYYMV